MIVPKYYRPCRVRSILSWCALLAACWGLAGPTRADESETFKAYQANWQKAQQAYTDKEYSRAATFYDEVRELLPFEPTTRFQLACCFAHLGDKDKALNALEAAISFGWDDPQRIEQAADLKDLRDEPRFSRLVKDAAVCRDEIVILHAGKSVDLDRPAPLLVLLQGLGCGPRAEVPYWKAAADQLGLILVAPRGVIKVGSMLYGWQRPGAKDSTAQDYFDIPAASKRIEEATAQAEKKFKIDKKRVLLAGFSQGGGVALRMLGDRPESYCGAVAVCSLCQPPGVDYWQAAKKRSVRVVVLAGKLDRLLPRSQQVVEQLRAAELAPRYEEVEKTGHEYPPDYPERLVRAIEFVLQQAHAGKEDQAEAILDKAIQAHGGQDAIEKYRGFRLKLKVTMEGNDRTPKEWEWLFASPDKYRQQREGAYLGRRKDSVYVTDEKGVRTFVDGRTQPVGDKLAQAHKDDLYLLNVTRLVPLKGKNYQVSKADDVRVGGKQALGLRVRSEGHNDVTLYFDKETGLLVKVQRKVINMSTLEEAAEERFYQDYRKQDGVQLPQKIIVDLDGKKTQEIEVKSAKLLEKVDESEFRG